MSARKPLPTASAEHVSCSRCRDLVRRDFFDTHACQQMSASDRAYLDEFRQDDAIGRARGAVEAVVGSEAGRRAETHAGRSICRRCGLGPNCLIHRPAELADDAGAEDCHPFEAAVDDREAVRAATKATAARANAQPADPSKRTVQIDGRAVDLYLVRLLGATCWCWVSPAHYTAPEGEQYRVDRAVADGVLVEIATIAAKHARHAENRARVLFGERARAASVGRPAHQVPASVVDEAFARAADPEPAIVAPSPAKPARGGFGAECERQIDGSWPASQRPAHVITIEEREHRGMPYRSVCSCVTFESAWHPTRFQAQRDGDAHAQAMA